MSQLLIANKNGSIVNETITYKKADPPKLGPAYGRWSGPEEQYLQLPGGAVLNFDLDRLTLADFRSMLSHYQVSSSLIVLSFMIHQLDWTIECEDKKIGDFVEDRVRKTWTRWVHGISQAFWAGYSPMAMEWDNDMSSMKTVITKFKDLRPEDCEVNWKPVNGWAPPGHVKPKFYVYDGIKQWGAPYPIPADNTFWYPLLMENGDYYGRKLLKPAFPAWFFSQLVHLFANRYYERFGEPTPLGRYADTDVIIGGQVMGGKEAMDLTLQSLRSRGVVSLPSDRDEHGNPDFDIDYLESQMRGADFERYLDRLDEEISLGLFTPVLLIRTADVGSYNLGVSHLQMYLWMLNALAGDLKEYKDKYEIRRMIDINFSPNAPDAYWVPRKLGKENTETLRSIVTALITKGGATVDFEELGQSIGLTLKEVKQLTDPNPPDPTQQNSPSSLPGQPGRVRTDRTVSGPRGVGQTRATGRQIAARVGPQIIRAFRERTFGETFAPTYGFRRRFEDALQADGFENPSEVAESFYRRLDNWMQDIIDLGISEYSGPDQVVNMLQTVIDEEVDRLAAG